MDRLKSRESELLRLRLCDSERFFAAVMSEYSGFVYSVVWNRLSAVMQKEDIEETVSDVFIRFFRSMEQYDPEKSSIKTYLALMAKQLAISKYRSLVRQRDCLSLEEDVLSELPATEPSVDEECAAREEQAKLLHLIFRLKEPNGTILFRKYYLNETTAQIAKRIGLTENAVEKRLKRTLVKLKYEWEGDDHG